MRNLLAVIFALSVLHACAEPRLSFDAEAWKAASVSFDGPDRSRLVPGLIQSYKLVGMSESELLNLLGPAESYADTPVNERWYLISQDFGTDLDPQEVRHLIFTFGSDGRVSRYEDVTSRKK